MLMSIGITGIGITDVCAPMLLTAGPWTPNWAWDNCKISIPYIKEPTGFGSGLQLYIAPCYMVVIHRTWNVRVVIALPPKWLGRPLIVIILHDTAYEKLK